MVGIYKITSPTGKIYIGQSININNRWVYYKQLNCKNQPKLYNSLLKYNSDDHVFEIIEECSENTLNEREVYWKQYYLDKFGWGNMLFCEIYDVGSSGPRTEETKQKMSLAKKGKKRSKETCNNIRKGKEGLILKTNKPILQYDLEGNFIQEWKGVMEASRNLKIRHSGISNCCLGILKTSHKYVWKYKDKL
jgi:hypothetical protein